MVELLLHFAVPFASLRALGVDWRKVTVASVIALTPDLDVLFQVHRSVSHSLVLLAFVALPLLVLARKHRNARSVILLATFGVATHLVLDVLGDSPTPLFWPLLDDSVSLQIALYLHIGSAPAIVASGRLLVQPTQFERFVSFNSPILTVPGLAISVLVLMPSLVEIRRNRATSSEKRRPQ